MPIEQERFIQWLQNRQSAKCEVRKNESNYVYLRVWNTRAPFIFCRKSAVWDSVSGDIQFQAFVIIAYFQLTVLYPIIARLRTDATGELGAV